MKYLTGRQRQTKLEDLLIEELGKEKLFDELMQALSSDEAIDNLKFIARMYDIRKAQDI